MIFTLLSIALLAFYFWMLFDCIKNEEDSTERVVWAFAIMLIPILFLPVYYFRNHRRRIQIKKALRRAEEQRAAT